MSLESYRPSNEQIIEAKFGQQTLEEAAEVSKYIFDCLKTALAQIGYEEGSTSEQKEKVTQFLRMWSDFADGLWIRTSDGNLTSPEVLETAIQGANSLLSATTKVGKDSAQKMIEALEKRYR